MDHKVILQCLTTGVVAYDSKGEYLFANDVAAQMFGFSSSDVLVRAGWDEVHRKIEIYDEEGLRIPQSRLPSRLAIQGNLIVPETLVRVWLKRSSEWRWILIKSTAILDESGAVQMIVNNLQDRTEQKKIQLERERLFEEVAIERARLESLIRQVGVGVVVLETGSGQTLFVNDEVKEICKKAHISIDHCGRLLDCQGYWLNGTPLKSEDWPSYRTLTEGISINAQEIEIVREDRSRGYIVMSSDPIRDSKGSIKAVAITLQDVTHIRRQERIASFLDEASRIFSSSLELQITLRQVASLSVQKFKGWCTVLLADQDGRLQEAAVAYEDPAKWEILKELRRLYPEDHDAPGWYGDVFRRQRSHFVPHMTEEMLRKSITHDERHLNLVLSLGIQGFIYTPLVSRGRSLGVLALASTERTYEPCDLDMAEEFAKRAAMAIENSALYETAQKESEERLRTQRSLELSEAQLVQALQAAQDAVRARDTLISASAHELLTPVAGSKLQMQLMRKRIAQGVEITPEIIQTMVVQTEHQLDRLNRLVNEMLDLSRINLGKLTLQRQYRDLSEIVRDTAERMAPQVQASSCELSVAIDPGVMGWVDSYRLEQVLANLLSNACRYARGKPVKVAFFKSASGAAVLTVQDEGMGISEQDHKRIFQRFERATTLDEGSGLGLGLFIAKEIVDAHGGNISLESASGQGAKFRVEIPLQTSK